MHWFIDPIKNHYADFEGRVGRQEYWMWVLFYFVFSVGLEIISIEIVTLLLQLAIVIPSIALAARRLHDTSRSGWWQLIVLIPIVGLIILIVWLATETEPVDNMYGKPAVPKMGPEGTPEVATASVVTTSTPTVMTETTPETPDVPVSSLADSSANVNDSSPIK